MSRALSATDIEPSLTDRCVPREFQRVDDNCYRLVLKSLGVEFTVDRLRRKWDELVGEMTVRCELAGALTFDGVLSVSDFNLSSPRSRQERANYLRARSKANDVDWAGLLEEFVQRVLTAERRGQPAVLLRDLPRPAPDHTLSIDGLPLLMRHPMILFGDGGAVKSYFALYLAGRLELQHGVRVGVFDWELCGEDHRDRLERLFGSAMPAIQYVRCDRPLVHEVDRLRRIAREQRLDYVVLDSIAFACDGPPEAAEVAGRYFQCVRQLGVGSLHVAHVSKSENADQKPFGSAFWFNGARSIWFAKLAETTPGGNQISVGLYHRKANLGGLKPAVGFEFTFDDTVTTVRRVELADIAELAARLSVRQRMAHVLTHGSMSAGALAEDIQADAETVKRTARRYKQQFVSLDGGRIGLLEHRV